LLERAGSTKGYLFVTRDGRFEQAAANPRTEPPSELRARIEALACTSTQDGDTQVIGGPHSGTEGGTTQAEPALTNDAAGYRIHLLWWTSQRGSEIVGAAAVHASGARAVSVELLEALADALRGPSDAATTVGPEAASR
jgi:hypothetical protein